VQTAAARRIARRGARRRMFMGPRR
jgi:hypothetical protein